MLIGLEGSNCTRMSVAVTELIDLQRITEGLLFDTEVVAGPDIYNNFGHGPVGKVTVCKLLMHRACYGKSRKMHHWFRWVWSIFVGVSCGCDT